MAANLFYYIGNDEAYFKALQGELKKSSSLPVELKRIYESNEINIQSIFLKIFKDRPQAVFIDFSKQTQDYLHLARILSRTPLDHKMISVGLLDYLSSPEVLRESIATGVNLCHVKSAETFDVVFDVQKLINPESSLTHGFATSSLSESWEAGIPCKIGHINHEGLHIETDFKLTVGAKCRVEHHWLTKRIVPSREVFIKATSSSNMFYQYRYNADIDFLFMDEVVSVEGQTAEEFQEKTNERNEYVTYHKRLLRKWMEDNSPLSQEKKAKVLVVDRTFPFYNNSARTDKYPYTIRSIAYFSDISLDIERNRPQVIAFSFDAEDVADKRNKYEELARLVTVLKAKFQDLEPFIIVFNTGMPSKELQEKLNYSKIMSYSGELSVEVLVRMADIFEKKLTNSIVTVKGEEKVFIKKNNPASICKVLIPITVVKLSETDLIFQSHLNLEAGMNLHIQSPVEMYIHILPTKSQGKIPEFYGVIHGLGETSKKELRRFVNTVFFRDHDAQVSAESEEFKRLNEAKLQEKIIKLQELAAKAEAETGEGESES